MNNTNQHAEGKNAHSAATGSLLQTTAPVWLGVKPAWCTWDCVVGKHWLGLKPSEPLNLASFVNFEDCKQDFVAKLQLESPYSSRFSCIRKNWRTPFFPPLLSWIIMWEQSVPGVTAGHCQSKATAVWILFLTWVCLSVGHSQWWSMQVIWLWSVKYHTWMLFYQIYTLKQIHLCWIYGNRALGDCWRYFFLTRNLDFKWSVTGVLVCQHQNNTYL